MEKIDRLGWAAGFSFSAYGVRIGVRSNDPASLERAHSLLPSGARESSSPLPVDLLYSLVIAADGTDRNVRRFNLLYADHVRLVRSSKRDDVFKALEPELRLTIAEHARNRIFVHAGVVGWNGRAIVIPGRSFTGKSTLVAELIKAGATYYSDEYAVIDARGRVHPFHKALELRTEDANQIEVDVTALGGKLGRKPLPVGLVVSTHYELGAIWKPRRMTRGRLVLELISNTVSARREPQKALSVLAQAGAHATGLKGARGEAAAVAASLLSSRWQG